ncbi:MAG: hypothetical protein AAFX10_15290 [Pseudomonadota bacterium]
MSSPVEIERPDVLTPIGQETLRRLMRTWFKFERRLERVPIVRRLNTDTFTADDYRALLLNLRQQVIEGSRWIARAASSFNRDFADVRSVVIGHAMEEHRDYEVLEQDYVASGGSADAIRSRPRNPGSDALHSFLMYRASLPNPVDMLGAMWIVEGLGNKMATDWASRIQDLDDGLSTRFLAYHGDNDDAHMDKLYGVLDRVCSSEAAADRIVLTAEVVGRLYALQLQEIDND